MKKFTGIFLVLICLPLLSLAQTDIRLSITFDPALTFNRYMSETDSVTFANPDNSLQFSFGLNADLGLTESYFFSTGILYSLRRVSLTSTTSASVVEDEEYQLEYIEIPVTLKLYTNDLGVDSKIYFQTGFTLDLLVNWKGIDASDDQISDFNFFDSSFYVGAGFDKQLGVSTAFYTGIFFQRGLINITNKSPVVSLKNDLLGLDLGLRF